MPPAYDAGVAFVTWTSGTTGAPEADPAHPRELPRAARPRARAAPRAAADGRPTPSAGPTPNLVPVSLALNAGIYNVLFGLRAGAAVVVMDRFEPARRSPSSSRGSRSARRCCRPPRWRCSPTIPTVVDLAPLRYVRSITAPLSPLQARRFTDKFGVVVLNGYGQAEIGEVIGWTAADAREHPEKLGAVGRPHPGVVDHGSPADDRAMRASTAGDRAAARAAADDRRSAIAPERVDADGYVDTGDLARIDDDGFVWIEGRAGDVINRGGNKVFPEHVEEVLRLVPGVAEAAVVGVADDRLGEVPGRVRRRRPPTSPTTSSSAACREHLAPYKVPVAFRRIDALPRSEVGKVLRRGAARRDRRARRTGRSGHQPAGRSREGCAGGSANSASACAIRSRTHERLSSAVGHRRFPTAHHRGDAVATGNDAEHLDGRAARR